jgi:hypothetical protein
LGGVIKKDVVGKTLTEGLMDEEREVQGQRFLIENEWRMPDKGLFCPFCGEDTASKICGGTGGNIRYFDCNHCGKEFLISKMAMIHLICDCREDQRAAAAKYVESHRVLRMKKETILRIKHKVGVGICCDEIARRGCKRMADVVD